MRASFGPEVSDLVYRFFEAVDACRWPDALDSMADPVHVDYSSFGGGDAGDHSPADVTAGWAQLLPGFDHTHHQLGQGQTRETERGVELSVYVTASHVLDGREWTVRGVYDLVIINVGGAPRIGSLRLRFGSQSGDLTLAEAAQVRVQAGGGRPG